MSAPFGILFGIFGKDAHAQLEGRQQNLALLVHHLVPKAAGLPGGVVQVSIYLTLHNFSFSNSRMNALGVDILPFITTAPLCVILRNFFCSSTTSIEHQFKRYAQIAVA